MNDAQNDPRRRRPDIMGRAFEESLGWLHQHYEANDIATVTYLGTRCEKKKKRRNQRNPGPTTEWVPLKSPPDYTATLTKWLSKACWFDAKFTIRSSYSHARDKLHQTDFLWRQHRADAIAFLLIQAEPYVDHPGRAWLVWPKEYWQEYYNKGFTIDLYNLPPEDGIECVGWSGVSNSFVPDWFETLMLWRASIDSD